jgi:putative endonuclease
MQYTYVLQSEKDKKWYTGCSSDLKQRLKEHNSGKVFATKNRGPFKIMYYEACHNEKDAFARERYLKSGQGKRYLKNRLKNFLFILLFFILFTSFAYKASAGMISNYSSSLGMTSGLAPLEPK